MFSFYYSYLLVFPKSTLREYEDYVKYFPTMAYELIKDEENEHNTLAIREIIVLVKNMQTIRDVPLKVQFSEAMNSLENQNLTDFVSNSKLSFHSKNDLSLLVSLIEKMLRNYRSKAHSLGV